MNPEIAIEELVDLILSYQDSLSNEGLLSYNGEAEDLASILALIEEICLPNDWHVPKKIRERLEGVRANINKHGIV